MLDELNLHWQATARGIGLQHYHTIKAFIILVLIRILEVIATVDASQLLVGHHGRHLTTVVHSLHLHLEVA